MKFKLKNLIPLFDESVSSWALEARLLRWLTLIWLFVGLAMLFSASYPAADMKYGDGLYFFKRQLITVFLGLILFNIIVNLPFRKIIGVSHWLLILFLGFIFITLVPGLGTRGVYGTSRWLSIGGFPIQPSELIKPFLVLQSARVFGHWEKLSWGIRIAWLVVFGFVLLGILAQPNLSTTALCGMTIWLIALASGLPYTYLGGTAAAGIVLALLSVTINKYQLLRITSFLNPWAKDKAQTTGYQLVQSLLAVGSGNIWGSGFTFSQQKLGWLPIQDSDFIFAVFAEEFGFVGSVTLLVMLAVFATLGLMVALKAKNSIYRLSAIGITTLLTGQSFINIGVATGVLPTTGLPLPFFSYGGSSIIATLVATALLIRVARESNEAEVVPLRRQPTKTRRESRFLHRNK
ncbi:MAG: FtsW/RodA/SpoVE family cell cycle protein [Richelia sp. RM2_1_2]|nr:FtsW/RodA/SpoVE family cell cycle protein [Richelia sp. SM1_7_0]NJN08012.1 FtsW/RodA/SpoVE family cell cycle protein [Richelia sp. RM1_1_1]NJO27828.1 FtsW/RodA/SpoVE family cell cycle protein [Richelia sp. SL_2_1]NJO58685.1 FtsW/RodA/SpoVE family cell cycle protein [Richelia sp. RM2_1_2]